MNKETEVTTTRLKGETARNMDTQRRFQQENMLMEA
jgi:hypothetical protein